MFPALCRLEIRLILFGSFLRGYQAAEISSSDKNLVLTPVFNKWVFVNVCFFGSCHGKVFCSTLTF